MRLDPSLEPNAHTSFPPDLERDLGADLFPDVYLVVQMSLNVIRN